MKTPEFLRHKKKLHSEATQTPHKNTGSALHFEAGRGYPPALSLRAKGSLASLEPAPPAVLNG